MDTYKWQTIHVIEYTHSARFDKPGREKTNMDREILSILQPYQIKAVESSQEQR